MEALHSSASRPWALLPLVLLMFVTAISVRAQEVRNLDYYLVQDGQVALMQAGQGKPVEREVALPNGMRLLTNGVIVLRPGVEKMLQGNVRLTTDGYWMGTDGRFTALEDHYALIDGKVVSVKDGVMQPVTQVVKLADGSVLTPQGHLQLKNGRRIRLLDGQMVGRAGGATPSADHVTAKQGQLLLQKDGSLLTLAPTRTMVMSDGSRITGDGTVVLANGKSFKLKVGQRLVLPGAAIPKSQ